MERSGVVLRACAGWLRHRKPRARKIRNAPTVGGDRCSMIEIESKAGMNPKIECEIGASKQLKRPEFLTFYFLLLALPIGSRLIQALAGGFSRRGARLHRGGSLLVVARELEEGLGGCGLGK